jgi:hypothetical protein
MMFTSAAFSTSMGVGAAVSKSTVKSSTLRALPSGAAKTLKLDLGSCARSMEYTTSPAVSGVPSWKTTPRRRWKRQRVGATISHDMASPGTSSSFLPRITSRS